jgi:hypothetical protein
MDGHARHNLTSAFLGAKHQIREMLEHGAARSSSQSTLVGYPSGSTTAAYAASKSGLIGLTQVLAPIRAAGYSCERDPARRGRHADVSLGERHADAQAFVTNLHALKRSDVQMRSRRRRSFSPPTTRRSSPDGVSVDGGLSITRT